MTYPYNKCTMHLNYVLKEGGAIMKIFNRKAKLLTFVLAMVLMISTSTTAFAATMSTVSKNATSKMSVYVPAGSYAWSNSVSIKFTSPNANATAAKVTAPLSTHSGNPVIIQCFELTAPSLNTYTIYVASANTGTITLPYEPIIGTWKIRAYCYSPTGMYSYGSSTFYPVSLTLTY